MEYSVTSPRLYPGFCSGQHLNVVYGCSSGSFETTSEVSHFLLKWFLWTLALGIVTSAPCRLLLREQFAHLGEEKKNPIVTFWLLFSQWGHRGCVLPEVNGGNWNYVFRALLQLLFACFNQTKSFFIIDFCKNCGFFFSYSGLQAYVESTAAVTLIMEQTQ